MKIPFNGITAKSGPKYIAVTSKVSTLDLLSSSNPSSMSFVRQEIMLSAVGQVHPDGGDGGKKMSNAPDMTRSFASLHIWVYPISFHN
ncbi:3066_t:CDS:2 [Funneliformis geosporum]|nr:3066_t:CDS:2 [Funneliformis geosporum]